ncbi:hypothetical protein RUND412_010008 [Rhizina undulata]
MSNTDILLAGAIAAFTVDFLVYPIDTLKTRLQSPEYRRSISKGTGEITLRKLKIKGLYQGVGSAIVATLPAAGLFFTTYEHATRILRNFTPVSEPLIPGIASSIGEIASCALITPAEVIKQNAQVLESKPRPQGKLYFTSLESFRHISHARDLWKGYGTLVARNLPFTALQFSFFERLKDYFREKVAEFGCHAVKIGAVAGLAAGCSGSVAAVLTTPIDVVKTRVMLSVNQKDLTREKDKAPSPHDLRKGKHKLSGKSAMEVVKEVMKEEGLKGFMRGGALRGVWTFVGSGLYLGSYEAAKVWLRQGKGPVDETI